MLGAVAILVFGLAVRRGTKAPAKKMEIRIEPGIDFEATHVVYHVTVRNRGDVTARDVVITPRIIPGPFLPGEPPRPRPPRELVCRPRRRVPQRYRVHDEAPCVRAGRGVPVRLLLAGPRDGPESPRDFPSPAIDLREGDRAAHPEELPGVGEH